MSKLLSVSVSKVSCRSPGMARITFEDLAALDDEQLDDDDVAQNNPEPMAEEEQERLFAHWQAVASTHQVSLPQEMSGPIQQMTRQNQAQEQEQVPYVPVSRHEKLEEVQYEERVYPAGKWACITKGEDMYEQSISMGFMKLMRYICKENSAEFQDDPPVPTDSEIAIVQRESIRVLSRVFYGTTTEETISRQISLLWELLGSTDDFHRDVYMVAVYQNPGVPCRRNEIWFIRRDP
ncbi:heme-binding protein soul4 isoform X3 [Amia ocellicauda]|uniref:heme-binding protein soul4 isoform X3 n=1 Tax=Amia ocellicauda TaxID=2972642 RepID=UPI003464DD41